jgi:hypothetical protein
MRGEDGPVDRGVVDGRPEMLTMRNNPHGDGSAGEFNR